MRRLLLAVVFAVAVATPGRAQRAPGGPAGGALRLGPDVSIRVVPEPAAPGDSLTVGDPFWVTVVPSGPRGYYLLPESVPEAYRPRPELAVLETERRDGRLRLKLALFRVGDVVLPEVQARVVDDSGDTLAVPVVSDTIRVASVLAPGDTLLADIKPLWEQRALLAWIWWALAAAALLVLAALWWWRRRRAGERVGPARSDVPVDPYADARERIEAAGRRTGDPAERLVAAAEIGDATRDYLAGAWGLPARERTTFEILPALPARLAGARPSLGAVFAGVDLAKFARVDPEAEGLSALSRRGLETLDRLEAARSVETAPPAREVAS